MQKGRNLWFLKSSGLTNSIFFCLSDLLAHVSPPTFNNTYINLEKPSSSGSGPVSRSKTAFVINGKIKKFPSLKSPESLDDTALGAVSSKLADHDGMPDRIRTCDLQSRSYVAVRESSAFWQVFMYDAQNMAVCKTAMNRCGAIVHSCFLCHRENSSQIVVWTDQRSWCHGSAE